ncbi:DNA adenine methylase [Helicobacter pylori]|uniref:DNA adenine methylase n=1 Tax=Helicobacter pylori TaxID=210 RepID=UPI002159F923|nr:DNA adenine methylase [Helicobacter pylori]
MGKLKNKEVYLSDINTELINAYQVVKTNPEKLIVELLRFKQNHSETFYHEVLLWDRITDFAKMCPIKRAARFMLFSVGI